MSDQQQEFEALARHLRQRNLDPDDLVVLLAHTIGFTVSVSIQAGLLTPDEAEQAIESLRGRIRMSAGLEDARDGR